MNHREYLKKVGLEFKVARVRQGLKLIHLTEKTGLGTNVISNLENGHRDAHILTYKRIADALGMDMKDFL